MIINEDKKIKVVTIWLTKEESTNIELNNSLKSIFDENKSRKYKTVVFHSGNDPDLTGFTGALLKHNKYDVNSDETTDDTISKAIS